MHARSALFDLYGDHLRTRGAQAPVASLVRLLAPLGITAPAARTAVSRMVRQGWLTPARVAGGPGYAPTPRASHRLDEAAERIHRHGDPQWDGRWHVVIVERVRERPRRDRVRAALHYLGYAPLLPGGWPGHEAADLFHTESARLLPAASRFVDCCLRADLPEAPARPERESRD